MQRGFILLTGLSITCSVTAMVYPPPGNLRAFPEDIPSVDIHEIHHSAASAALNHPHSSRRFKIVIGNKSYSSWSLRAWLALKHAVGHDFEEVLCPLAGADASEDARDSARDRILAYSPSGKVPALLDRALGVTVWESLAIVLHIASRFPDAELLPVDPAARAVCLSVCAEMHAGFQALRANLPMNCAAAGRRHGEQAMQRSDVRRDIDRLCELWGDALERFGRPAAAAAARAGDTRPATYLFGHFSAADCMFAPVALRFRTYDPESRQLTPTAGAYVAALCAHPAVEEWVHGARAEGSHLRIPHYEALADSGAVTPDGDSARSGAGRAAKPLVVEGRTESPKKPAAAAPAT